VIGFFASLTGPGGRVMVTPDVRQFVMAGVCGGYTTFSAFSLQTLTLAQHGEVFRAGLNVGASVTLCLVAVWLGYLAAAVINPARAG
jgi:CrcB protein